SDRSGHSLLPPLSFVNTLICTNALPLVGVGRVSVGRPSGGRRWGVASAPACNPASTLHTAPVDIKIRTLNSGKHFFEMVVPKFPGPAGRSEFFSVGIRKTLWRTPANNT